MEAEYDGETLVVDGRLRVYFNEEQAAATVKAIVEYFASFEPKVVPPEGTISNVPVTWGRSRKRPLGMATISPLGDVTMQIRPGVATELCEVLKVGMADSLAFDANLVPARPV